MTPSEVLKEIQKMPISVLKQLRDRLNDELAEKETNGHKSNELRLINSMKQKGLINDVPKRMKGTISRRRYSRVNVIGKPISETIIEDRG